MMPMWEADAGLYLSGIVGAGLHQTGYLRRHCCEY